MSDSDSVVHRRIVVGLWSLLALFCLRVLGQVLVETLHVSFLPPSPEWFLRSNSLRHAAHHPTDPDRGFHLGRLGRHRAGSEVGFSLRNSG